jgi:hypothetical protein
MIISNFHNVISIITIQVFHQHYYDEVTQARWDSGIFVEIKCLFSIAPKNGTKGEVIEVIIAVFRAIDAGFTGVRHRCRVWCFALGGARCSLCDRR